MMHSLPTRTLSVCDASSLSLSLSMPVCFICLLFVLFDLELLSFLATFSSKRRIAWLPCVWRIIKLLNSFAYREFRQQGRPMRWHPKKAEGRFLRSEWHERRVFYVNHRRGTQRWRMLFSFSHSIVDALIILTFHWHTSFPLPSTESVCVWCCFRSIGMRNSWRWWFMRVKSYAIDGFSSLTLVVCSSIQSVAISLLCFPLFNADVSDIRLFSLSSGPRHRTQWQKQTR